MQELYKKVPVHFFSNTTLRSLFFVSLIIFIAGLLFILFQINTLSLPVILHFDILNGVDVFGGQSSVWGVWGLGFVFFVLNSVLCEVFFFCERALSFVFLGTNLLLSILFLIIISVIITVN
jgi:hypothetical protein